MNLLKTFALLGAMLFATQAYAGTPTGTLNPDGSITYVLTGGEDVPAAPFALAGVEVGTTGGGFYTFQVLETLPTSAVGTPYLLTWDRQWSVEMSLGGNWLASAGGSFAGQHGGTFYLPGPEPVMSFHPLASAGMVPRGMLRGFQGRPGTLVDLDWSFPPSGNGGSLTAWSEGSGYVGTGYAANALGVEFFVRYIPK